MHGCRCGVAEGDLAEPQDQRAEATSRPSTRRMASSGWRAKVELTTRNSLMKMPSGGRPAIADHAKNQPPAEHGMRSRSDRSCRRASVCP